MEYKLVSIIIGNMQFEAAQILDYLPEETGGLTIWFHDGRRLTSTFPYTIWEKGEKS